MKKTLLLSLILCGIISSNEDIFGKTTEKNRDEIEWEYVTENKDTRSLFPISGYVEDISVTLYLYNSPTNVLVFISNISGDVVYECVYPTMSQETIDLSTLGIGMYEIVVEYGEKSFVGYFSL